MRIVYANPVSNPEWGVEFVETRTMMYLDINTADESQKAMINDIIMYDNSYVIMVLDSSRIVFFSVYGLQKTRLGEAYNNSDILAMVANDTFEVTMVQGYSAGNWQAAPGAADEYKYYFMAIEKETVNGTYFIKNY